MAYKNYCIKSKDPNLITKIIEGGDNDQLFSNELPVEVIIINRGCGEHKAPDVVTERT